MTTAGQIAVIANCKLRIANCKLLMGSCHPLAPDRTCCFNRCGLLPRSTSRSTCCAASRGWGGLIPGLTSPGSPVRSPRPVGGLGIPPAQHLPLGRRGDCSPQRRATGDDGTTEHHRDAVRARSSGVAPILPYQPYPQTDGSENNSNMLLVVRIAGEPAPR